MRIQVRLLLGMLTLAIPAAVAAAPFGDNDGAYAGPGAGPGAAPAARSNSQPPPHHHKGLFGRRHCVECQRAYVKAHDGIDIPAPPALEQGAGMHGPMMAAQGGSCPTCQGNAVTAGPIMTADAHAPGYAVVGGPGAMASASAPGYAVVGGEFGVGGDPTPIGVSRAGQSPYGAPRMAAAGPRPGSGGSPYDPAVVPTGTPPAQVAVPNPANQSRYKVIAHLLGVPKFGQRRREEEDKERQKHAAISYDQGNAKVSELPASMVYGKGDH
jgi:hypothetical protein